MRPKTEIKRKAQAGTTRQISGKKRKLKGERSGGGPDLTFTGGHSLAEEERMATDPDTKSMPHPKGNETPNTRPNVGPARAQDGPGM